MKLIVIVTGKKAKPKDNNFFTISKLNGRKLGLINLLVLSIENYRISTFGILVLTVNGLLVYSESRYLTVE